MPDAKDSPNPDYTKMIIEKLNNPDRDMFFRPLNLNGHAQNVLWRCQIFNLRQLVMATESVILKAKACGRGTIKHIRDELARFNLRLGMTEKDIDYFCHNLKKYN